MPLVEAAKFLESVTFPLVALDTPFVDARGVIQNLTTKGAQSVALITSKAGTERASHIHKTDDHLSVVVSGRIEYWWQDVALAVDGNGVRFMNKAKHVVVEAGQAFYTPRHVAHTMYFLEDTTFITLACQSREHADHEADLIRVPSLKPAETSHDFCKTHGGGAPHGDQRCPSCVRERSL